MPVQLQRLCASRASPASCAPKSATPAVSGQRGAMSSVNGKRVVPSSVAVAHAVREVMQRVQFLRLPDAARRAARQLGTRPRHAPRALARGDRRHHRSCRERWQHALGNRIAAAVVELERLGVAEFAFGVEEHDAEPVAQKRARRMPPEAHEIVEGDGRGQSSAGSGSGEESPGDRRAERERAASSRALGS